MIESLEQRFKEIAPAADFVSLRYVCESGERTEVRQGVLEPVECSRDAGAMITVIQGGGLGYAATCDLSVSGLRQAASAAMDWARATAGRCVVDPAGMMERAPRGEYASRVEKPWESLSLAQKVELLQTQCRRMKTDDRIADWLAAFWRRETESLYLTADGGRVHQRISGLVPWLQATAFANGESQHRTFFQAQQGGLEILDRIGYAEIAPRLTQQALELLAAPNCPSGTMDVLLAPDQMYLQIHESIGHPLELDRILGDERNYAGTSFVTLDMLGSYQYGSKLLNITFDPTIATEFASYGFDDDGTPAKKEYIIRDGILERPLGSAISQQRAGVKGVANSRACSWNRPPIDRMANLNLEPGTSSFDEMIAAVENGVYMQSNKSWSIDDSRNKFQFGCEYGRLIKNGKLDGVVKNPNYRGVSSTFWRSLKMVGDADTHEVTGTPGCGKGEPNQGVCVGHASPTCLFANVEVFGGE